jgi:hypothetical protein
MFPIIKHVNYMISAIEILFNGSTISMDERISLAPADRNDGNLNIPPNVI